MGSKWKSRAIELVTGLALTGKKNPATVPYVPQKTEVSLLEVKHFKRTSPERRGISSRRIYDMLSALEENPRANVHNIIVVKDGEIISEASRKGYSVNIRHLSHSMSKTLTGMAIGILVSDGRLSLKTRLVDIFPEHRYQDKRFEDINIHHLLSMSTGVPFSEVGSVTDSEWTAAFFSSRLSFAPGTAFAYNSMNSYMLARVVVRITGMSLMTFMNEHVFHPLGITNAFWEIGPEGIEKGGWGVHLSAESWAKLGVMMLYGGVFEGRRILPKEWVQKCTSNQMRAPDSAGDYNYGYQLWVHRQNDQFLFNGMLGQNVWVCPRNNIVVVAMCENNELFQKSAVLEIIERYLGDDLSKELFDTGSSTKLREKEKSFFEGRRYAKPATPKKGLLYRIGLKNKKPFDPAWSKLLGSYDFNSNNQGILPIFIRAMQNSYTGGIESMRFERDGEKLIFVSTEGGVDFRIEIGLYEHRMTVLNYNGEKYLVNAIGEAASDEDGHKIYKIELALPEMPNTRTLRISFGEDGRLIVRMSEMPNENIALPLVEGIYTTNPKLAFAVKLLERNQGDKFISRKLSQLFSPTLVGANTVSKRHDDIIEDDKARAREAERTTAAISDLISRVTTEIDDD